MNCKVDIRTKSKLSHLFGPFFFLFKQCSEFSFTMEVVVKFTNVTTNNLNYIINIYFVYSRCNIHYSPHLLKNKWFTLFILLFFLVAPEVYIVDEFEQPIVDKYYEVDSTIELMCIVRHVSMLSSTVNWLHGNKLLNFDMTRGGIR